VELLAELRRMRDEFRPGTPLDIGGIADFLYVGTPPPALELPRGTVAGAPEAGGRVPAHVRGGRGGPGAGAVPVAGSVGELCDQIAAFADQVVPLVD
jgi:hypothetical protein